eukprot:m.121862 g.121862  ORF g.121862 m.121862 type:complete len:348 (+) comp9384_c1_seq1:3304-4347(+)
MKKKKATERKTKEESQVFVVRTSCSTPQVLAVHSSPLHTTATLEALRTKSTVLLEFLNDAVNEALKARPTQRGSVLKKKLELNAKKMKVMPPLPTQISIAALPQSLSLTGRPELASFSQQAQVSPTRSVPPPQSMQSLTLRRPMTSPAQLFTQGRASSRCLQTNRPKTSHSLGTNLSQNELSLLCPSLLNEAPPLNRKACKCGKGRVPELSDKILDSYLLSQPAELVLVAVVDERRPLSQHLLDVVNQLYREHVNVVKLPCLAPKTLRFFQYSINKSRGKNRRLLEGRYGITSGVLLVFHGMDLVFLQRTIEGRKLTVKGVKEKIQEWKTLAKMKRFLPRNFNASRI